MSLKTSQILGLLISGLVIYATSSVVYAGGGRIEMGSSEGVANTSAAQVKAIIRNEQTDQFSPGEQGSFSFQNAASGQSCTTSNQVSNSQGEILGSCSSPVSGSFLVVFKLTTGEERTVAINFVSAPTPTAPPQNLSGNYTLEVSNANVTITNEFNTGYGVNATLKDKNSGEVVIHQNDIEYVWVSNNSDIVRISEIKAMCISPVHAPCPRVNVQMEGYKPGTAAITVTTKKGGQTIANAAINVTVNQASQNARWTAPTNTPAPSSNPSPTASPTPAVTAKPTSKVTPTSSVEPTPSPEEISPFSLTSTSPAPSPTASSQPASTALKRSKATIPWDALLLVTGIGLGIGLPIGWFAIENNPTLKAQLLQRWQKMQNIFRKK